MPLIHFKRYRMKYELEDPIWDFTLPIGYRWVPWHSEHCHLHASVKHRSFQNEVDANVFPCFSSLSSCRRLMNEISRRDGFLPQATWLVAKCEADDCLEETNTCGTVQGVKADFGLGSIQNLGVTAEHRGKGIGRALLGKALEGFREAGMKEVILEVTCDNFGAVRLYQRLGWKVDQVVFKSADINSAATGT